MRATGYYWVKFKDAEDYRYEPYRDWTPAYWDSVRQKWHTLGDSADLIEELTFSEIGPALEKPVIPEWPCFVDYSIAIV